MNEFTPVNDFIICSQPAEPKAHGELVEYVVAKAPHPFDGIAAGGAAAPAGTLALPKGTRIVAHPCDTSEIDLDGTPMLALRASDIVGVVKQKPDPKPIAPVYDMAAYRQSPAAKAIDDLVRVFSERTLGADGRPEVSFQFYQ